MMTPLDIQTKSFSNAPLGYKKTEVDSFTEEVLTNYETLYKSYNEANEKIKALQKEIDTYKGMEDTMKNTLVVAQSSAEQLTSSARKEAEAIVNEANVKSQEIIAKANERLGELTAQYENLKTEISMFLRRSKVDMEVQVMSMGQLADKISGSSV